MNSAESAVRFKGLLSQTGRKYKWFLFAFLFLISILYSHRLDITNYPYDSDYYWNTANSVLEGGHFDLLKFPDTFRGYLLPLALTCLKPMLGIWTWRIITAFCCASVFAFALPRLVKNEEITTWQQAGRAFLVYLIFLLVWGKFIQYPLSDLPAAAMLLGAGAICRYFTGCNQHKHSMWGFALWGGAAGILCYGAYNVRAAYLYGVLGILFYLIVSSRKKRNLLIFLFALLLGAIIISLPQCIINQHYTGKFTPRVLTEAYAGNKSLQSQQVLWGLTYDRYETYTGDMAKYPDAHVYFRDPTGEEIVRRENIIDNDFTLREVFKLYLKYPLDMLGIYVRHLISLLTPFWDSGYIEELYTDKWLIASASMLIWLTAFYSILVNRQSGCWIRWNDLLIFSMCLPCLLQLLGAVELRFFLTVYLLVYYKVFAAIDYRRLLLHFRTNWIPVISCGAAILLMWISIAGSILSNNAETVLLIQDKLP